MKTPVDKRAPEEFAIRIFPRTYHCPLCTTRTLHGYTFDSQPSAMVLDRFLFPWLQYPFHFNLKGERLPQTFVGLFDIYVCPIDLFCQESRVAIQQGKVLLPAKAIEFYESHGGKTPTAHPTLREMFYQVLINHKDSFLNTNWLLVAKENMNLSYRGWLKFSKKPLAFRALLDRHLDSFEIGMGQKDFIQTSFELADALESGLPGLFSAQSFRNRKAVSFLLQYKLYELTYLLHELAEEPFYPLKAGENPLMMTLRTLMAFLEVEEIDRLTVSMITVSALRLAVVTQSHIASKRALAVAFYATELFQKCRPWDYQNRGINPNLLITNNEAMLYVNILLRKMMRIPDTKCLTPYKTMMDKLLTSLRNEKIYSQYNTGEDSSRRGVLLGDHLKGLAASELGLKIE